MEKLILIGLGVIAYLYVTQDAGTAETPANDQQPAAVPANQPVLQDDGVIGIFQPAVQEPTRSLFYEPGFNPLRSIQDHLDWVYSIPVGPVLARPGVIDARDYDDDPYNDSMLGGAAMILAE